MKRIPSIVKWYFNSVCRRLVFMFFFIYAKCLRKQRVVILCYHSINRLPNLTIQEDQIVEPHEFEKQLEFLSSFRVVSLRDFVAGRVGDKTGVSFIMTFDDY